MLVAFIKFIYICIIFLYHLNDFLQLFYSLFLWFKQLYIVEFHRIWPVHFVDSTYIVLHIEVLGSWLCYYLYPSVSYSWIWLRTHLSPLICCRLCLFYLVVMMQPWWCAYCEGFFFPTLLAMVQRTCVILSLNEMKLFDLLNLWTSGRNYDVGCFFIRTRGLHWLILRTHITPISLAILIWRVFRWHSFEYRLHSLVI